MHGNPKYYGTFKDESLNMILRTVAAFAHRLKLEYRVFALFKLQGALKLNLFLFGAANIDM